MYNKMHHYLSLLCMRSKRNFLYGLKLFSEGIGLQHGEIMIEFPDNPDREDCYKKKYSDCVGFYNDYDPPDLFVPMQEFLNYLKKTSETYLADKDSTYKEQANLYLRKIYKRYSDYIHRSN
ncbi:MAG: hypothetical protein K2K16_08260 [Ruminococcus sp.]|nr:hypothetical protein [Ruminococcus sp.]